MKTDTVSELPNVFLFSLAPAANVAPPMLGQRLIEQSSKFTLAARPNLDTTMLSHSILRGIDGQYVWQIVFEGVDLPAEDLMVLDGMGEALLGEIQERIAGLGEVMSFTGYVDLSHPSPGLGFARDMANFSDDYACWEDYVSDSGAPDAGQQLPVELLKEIEENRKAVPNEAGLKRYGVGHMYGGGRDAGHVAYLRNYLETKATKANFGDRRKILAFLAFQAREGSTAAINTYDNQIVTWGTGWGGLGWLGSVMRRATSDDGIRDKLGSVGVRYRDKNVYDVVDLGSKKIVTGSKNALEAIRASVPLLNTLIDVARNEATRDAATEAQLQTFMGGSANISNADVVSTQALFNLIAHLMHWAPGYANGCLDWAAPQVSGSPSAERDKRLAVLVGRYFYGKARKYKWIPDWKQFQLYWKHMKEDGLDALSDPFIQASGPPTDDPFANQASRPQTEPEPTATPTKTSQPEPSPAGLKNAPLAGQAELLAIVSLGQGSIRKGARGGGVKALQEALILLGYDVPGGADGIFGAGLERAIQAFQRTSKLTPDGIVGRGTLGAIDAALSTRKRSAT